MISQSVDGRLVNGGRQVLERLNLAREAMLKLKRLKRGTVHMPQGFREVLETQDHPPVAGFSSCRLAAAAACRTPALHEVECEIRGDLDDLHL